jgi:quinol monooxygenase YgiN
MFRFLALAVLAMTMLGGTAALAQNATFYTVSYVEVVPAAARPATTVLRAYRNAGRKDAGNVRFELLQGIARQNQFTVIGAWSDQKAFEAHVAAAHTKEMQSQIAPVLVAPIDTRQHNGLAVAPAAEARGGAIFAVTHVDVIPPQKDNGVAAVGKLAEDSRKHAGNMRFEVWQQTNRPNHFTVVEAWASRKAFDIHLGATETKDFRSKLATMTGALYDERLFKTVR